MGKFRVIDHADVLAIATTSAQAMNMITHIMTGSSLLPEYHYIYTLFTIFNKIYHGAPALDISVSTAIKSQVDSDFDDAHYHVSVAIGLAAGIITSPGVSPELSNATAYLQKAKGEINGLKYSPSSTIVNTTSRQYVEDLTKASTDPALNVSVLVKKIIWTTIVDIDNKAATMTDFTNKLSEIYIQIVKLKNAQWADLFKLEGLKINVDSPGTDDDLNTIGNIVTDVGFFVGLAGIGVQIYSWKVNGPGKIMRAIINKFKSGVGDAEAGELADAQIALEGEEAIEGLSALDIATGVLAVIGVLLLIIGTIIEIVQLSAMLKNINHAKTSFDQDYSSFTKQIQSTIQSSEKFRLRSKDTSRVRRQFAESAIEHC